MESNSNNTNKPNKPSVMLGGVHIYKAVHDSSFFSLMPEFSSIREQMKTMHIDMKSKKGCNSCNKRRLHANIDGNFAAIASSLSSGRVKVLKKYLGLDDDQKFYIRSINPTTHQPVLKAF